MSVRCKTKVNVVTNTTSAGVFICGRIKRVKTEGQKCVVYYESRKRDLKTRPMYECRCDERLKTKDEKSTRLVYTGLIGKKGHLKIKTRLIDEMFTSVMGEYVFLK
jgi:hypothetical protein